MAAPNPNTNPPSVVIAVNCQAPAGARDALESRKNGIVMALIQSMDLTMLTSINARREYISSAIARTVQMLARWVENPRMAASTAVTTRADMAQDRSTAEPIRPESARPVLHVAEQRSKILRLVNSGPTAIRLMFRGQIMRFAAVLFPPLSEKHCKWAE